MRRDLKFILKHIDAHHISAACRETYITIGALSNENMRRLIESRSADGLTATDAEQDAETYESIESDGVFRVIPCGVRGWKTADDWDFMKRRILVNSMRISGTHEYHMLFGASGIYAYQFTDDIHVTGLPDGTLQEIVMLVDYSSPKHSRPVLFKVYTA